MRSTPHLSRTLLAAFLILLSVPPLMADTVKQMNLAEMVQRAEKIYRGRVLSATPGTVTAGGGEIPVVTYRLIVEEIFQGDIPTEKGLKIAELRTLGKMKSVRQGNLQWISPLPRVPEMAVGKTYLVFTTRPSAIGLSSTVGLAQGRFEILNVGKDETALNGVNNSGLFRDMPGTSARTSSFAASSPTGSGGPISYSDLAQQIRAQLGQ